MDVHLECSLGMHHEENAYAALQEVNFFPKATMLDDAIQEGFMSMDSFQGIGDDVDTLDCDSYVFDVKLDNDYDDGDVYLEGVPKNDQLIIATGDKLPEHLVPMHETCGEVSSDHEVDKLDGFSEEEDTELMDLLHNAFKGFRVPCDKGSKEHLATYDKDLMMLWRSLCLLENLALQRSRYQMRFYYDGNMGVLVAMLREGVPGCGGLIYSSEEAIRGCWSSWAYGAQPLAQLLWEWQDPFVPVQIVAATNIAETSITIEDVVHVIDCGKHKEMQYDSRRGMSRMEEAWVSQANVKQRCGRAGRVQPGYCFALYTKYRFQELLRPFQLPEILRVPLVELCLQIKSLSLGKIGAFLEKAIERPKIEAVDSAIRILHEVGALDSKEELTALGFHLAKLPVDVHIGKMILYGAILGCVSPILTIAACLSYKSPFSAPQEQTLAAEKAKRAFVDAKKNTDNSSSICRGQQSDQLAIAAAYNSWSTVVHKHGARAGYDYCKANYLSIPTLIMLRDLRLQFAVLLADIGFISLQKVNALKNNDLDRWVNDQQRPFNCNAQLPSISKATMCAGLYPNIAKMDDESVRSGHANALTSRAGLASSQKVLWTDGRQEVFIHPSSVNHDVSEFQYPFLMYHEKVKTSKVYIRDTTIVSPYTLLLFGGAISVQHQTGQVSVDGWLRMNAPAQTAVLFKELRAAVGSILEELIRNPKNSFGNANQEVVSYILKLLVEEERVQKA
ncbi:hypothetical protein L7F22_025155 [Adiantum nelumboides]|nr:hypothetical protein [Adiantum nelumboides]